MIYDCPCSSSYNVFFGEKVKRFVALNTSKRFLSLSSCLLISLLKLLQINLHTLLEYVALRLRFVLFFRLFGLLLLFLGLVRLEHEPLLAELVHTFNKVLSLLNFEVFEHTRLNALLLLGRHPILFLDLGEGVEQDGEEQV